MDSPPSRLERSIAEMRPNNLLPDGRRAVYFTLLDLSSKPFWKASEAGEGVAELVADLLKHREQILQEVREMEGKGFGNEWSVLTVVGDGHKPSEERFPFLIPLLSKHSCVSFSSAFQASLVSVLGPKGYVAAHCGPTNFRLRVQIPLLMEPGTCVLRCGSEETRYEDGYAIIDDAYVHSAQNESNSRRIMLIVDVWHPEVTLEERVAMEEAIKSQNQ